VLLLLFVSWFNWTDCYFLVVSTADDAIDKFLGKYHDESRLKDVSVEEMRHIIPKLFMYCDNHDTSCRKGLVLLFIRIISFTVFS